MNISSSGKPFLSIITSSHNSAKMLERAYLSILNNTNSGKIIEWLIIDDGSNDDTEDVVSGFEETPNLIIRYFRQRYSGKFAGLNSLSKLATGMFTLELDPEEYLSKDAVKVIKENCFLLPNIYAFVFQKETPKGKIVGDMFKSTGQNTTMFSIRNVENASGDKSFVYNTSIRRKIFYQEDLGEIPVVTDTINYELDQYFEVFAFNNPIVTIGSEKLKKEAYRKSNLKKDYQENAFSYYYYYKELLSFNLKEISRKKKHEILKNYILFGYITGMPLDLTTLDSVWDKIVTLIMYLPVRAKAKSEGYKVVTESLDDYDDVSNDYVDEVSENQLKKDYEDISNFKTPKIETKDVIESRFKTRTQPINTLTEKDFNSKSSRTNKEVSKKLDALIQKAKSKKKNK